MTIEVVDRETIFSWHDSEDTEKVFASHQKTMTKMIGNFFEGF